MKPLFLALALLIANCAAAQENSNSEASQAPEVYTIIEVMPAYKGGEQKLHKFIRKNLKFELAKDAPREKLSAYVKFIIQPDGTVNGTEIVKSSGNADFDAAVVKMIDKMPDWTPGSQRGKNVAVSMMLPISWSPSKE